MNRREREREKGAKDPKREGLSVSGRERRNGGGQGAAGGRREKKTTRREWPGRKQVAGERDGH